MNRPKALGVHIYAGGFTLGMQKHLDVVALDARHRDSDHPKHFSHHRFDLRHEDVHGSDLVTGEPFLQAILDEVECISWEECVRPECRHDVADGEPTCPQPLKDL